MAKATEKPKVGYVTVATVRSRDEARHVAGKLAAAKIDHFIAGARGVAERGATLFRLGEFKVQVHRAEVRAALRALGQTEVGPNALGPEGGIFRSPNRLSANFGGRLRFAIEIGALIAIAAALAALIF